MVNKSTHVHKGHCCSSPTKLTASFDAWFNESDISNKARTLDISHATGHLVFVPWWKHSKPVHKPNLSSRKPQNYKPLPPNIYNDPQESIPRAGECVNTLIRTLIAPYAAPGSCTGVKGNGVLRHGKASAKGPTPQTTNATPASASRNCIFHELKSREFNYTTWECMPKEALLETKPCWYARNQEG